jgi:hypothetical protein
MHGAPDPLYVAARRALLDALEALGVQRDAVVLVGAQAVYLHTGAGDLAVAPYTTDADLAIDPSLLAPAPLLEEALGSGGFSRLAGVGAWGKAMLVEGVRQTMVVDFLVPESLGGPGRRAARIPPHETGVARKVAGLDAVLVDQDMSTIGALDERDTRAYGNAVAGPAALLVAKTFKVAERGVDTDRMRDKDALDVLRLLQATPTDELARRMRVLLADGRSSNLTRDALERMVDLFGTPRSAGSSMAARAAAPLVGEATIRASISILTQRLLEALG